MGERPGSQSNIARSARAPSEALLVFGITLCRGNGAHILWYLREAIVTNVDVVTINLLQARKGVHICQFGIGPNFQISTDSRNIPAVEGTQYIIIKNENILAYKPDPLLTTLWGVL